MKYELNEMYMACAETPVGSYRIYFTFSESHIESDVHCVSIRTNPRYHYEHICFAPNATICYSSPDGHWFMTARKEQYPTWVFKRGGHTYEPEVLEVGMKGKHYEAIVEDDMVDAAMYGTGSTPTEYAEEEARRAPKWYERAKKEEVKSEMELQLINVIFFNKKTKTVDYRKDIVAADTEEAYMLAAQDYKKYDVKIHIRRANYILSFRGDYIELPE